MRFGPLFLKKCLTNEPKQAIITLLGFPTLDARRGSAPFGQSERATFLGPLSEKREGGDRMENILQALSLIVAFITMVYTILTYNHTKKK